MPAGPNYNLISPFGSAATSFAAVTVTGNLNVGSTVTAQSLSVSGAATLTGNVNVATTLTAQNEVLTGTATGSLTDGLWFGPQGATDIRVFKQASNFLAFGMGNGGVNGYINGPTLLAGQYGVGGTANGTQFFLNGVSNTGMYLQSSGGQLLANNVISFSWGTTGACTVLGNLAVASVVTGYLGTNWRGGSKSSNYTVVAADSFTAFDNAGAVGTVKFTLPVSSPGLVYMLSCVAGNQTVTIGIASGDAWNQFGNVKSGPTTVSSNGTNADAITFICTSQNNWVVQSVMGTWA